MSEPSRQLRYQRAHKAEGLCWSCSRPVFKGGLYCDKHLRTNAKTLKLRERWKAVDWSQKNKEIAAQLGVTYHAVYIRRRRASQTKL